MSNREYVSDIIKSFVGQANVIPVHVTLVKFFEDWNAAILFSQLVYWSDRTTNDEGWIYKTADDWYEEIYLSRYQVKKAQERLEKMEVIETTIKKANGSPTTHYKVNFDKLSESFLKFLQNQNSSNLKNESKGTSKSLTKTTTKTTSKITMENSGASAEVAETHDSESHSEPQDESTAIRIIREAREGRFDWDKISDTSFTHYYIHVHNQLFKKSISLKWYDVSMLKNGLINRYELPRHLIADVIDKLLESFSVHPKNKQGMLNLYALENDFLPNGFVQKVVWELKPIERKYRTCRSEVKTESKDITDVVF